ncbi:MAG TPA: aspartyl protease family protein [Thermoanaerobaculia bacterium]|nr:aspartyl protease family protein [Thermoanaerobaculia bacterium]
MRRTILLLLFATSLFAREVARVPADIRGNRVLVNVAVDDHPPSAFVLDTGAARTVVAQSFAEARGIRATGRGQAMGASASVEIGLASRLVFSFADIRIPAKDVPLIPLGPINLRAGAPVGGVLGREAFRNYVVDLNYERAEVVFHDRRSFRAPEGAVTVPLHFGDHRSMPQVDVRLTLPGGRVVPARLHLDTGAGPGLILTRAFTRKHDIQLPDAIETSLGLGVGGASSERTARIARLDFAGFAIDRPIAMLSHSTKGVLGGEHIDGLLGGEILRRFHVQIDYGRKQTHLTRNANFGEPVDIDMLGATLAARDDSFRAIEVQSLIEKSAATEAGLRKGDELRAIDGRAVTPRELDAIRKMFRKPDQRHELTIVRDGKEMVVPVTTRRIV